MIVYDTGALIAAERADRTMWRLHDVALRRAISPLVPSPVLAQAWRGGRQANLARFLRGCTIAVFDEPWARAAGELLARADRQDIVDASVVTIATELGAAVITADRDDLAHLVDVAGSDVPLHDI